MSQLDLGASSGGEAVPSSSASSRRDGNDMTVPATPPIAHARADSGAAGLLSGVADASQQSATSSSMFEHAQAEAAAATSTPHVSSSQIIPDSQESATIMHAGDTRPAAAALLSSGAAAGGQDDTKGQAGPQLLQLSAIAAAQQRIDQEDAAAGSRKRMANGEVKTRSNSNSPIKGHGRSVSAISMNSTGSHIGDVRIYSPSSILTACLPFLLLL